MNEERERKGESGPRYEEENGKFKLLFEEIVFEYFLFFILRLVLVLEWKHFKVVLHIVDPN